MLDQALVTAYQTRIRAVADVLAAGLTHPIANGLGKTILEWEKMGDMMGADVSLDGITRTENDRLDFGWSGLPLPITHKDWYLNLRMLAASRERGEAIDTTYSRVAGRKIAEASEEILIRGGITTMRGFKTLKFMGLNVYGYTTYPDRNAITFGDATGVGVVTSIPWGDATKTGDGILADVKRLIAAAEGDRKFGPYIIYVGGTAASLKLASDYKAATSTTIRQRILDLEQISDIRTLDMLPVNEVLLIEMSSDTIEMVIGEPLQTVQWDVHGGFQINFKGFQIVVPLIRSDSEGRCGIVHMTVAP